ncbi:MAG: helix-turn-helix domain-containing protein [Gammaproteobacteria bacterium]|nr:helix-turn-helix domain-containing protein [Gammaproteobacteria bacterium]
MDNKMFTELLGSVKEMDQIAQGKKKPARAIHFPEPEIKAIREKTGLSQSNFALLIGVSKRTLENWEQGRRHPTGPAKVLLRLLNDDPKHAIETLHQ